MHPLSKLQKDRMRDDLTYLTGSDTAGRLSGSLGARKAAEYLQSQLQASGYKPIQNGNFMVPVDVLALRITGRPTLRIGDEELKYRLDYAELNAASSGGTVHGNLLVLRDRDNVDVSDLDGTIVLIPERPNGFDARATAKAAAEAGVKALLVEGGEPHSFHKSPNGGHDTKLPVLRIRKSIADWLIVKAGEAVFIDLPLRKETQVCQNVVGFLSTIHGMAKTVVLTAHYDHLGDDPDGVRFPGTIDNASGVAIVLEIVRGLAERNDSLPFHVLVAFLTGEESGMVGANHLATHPPVPLSAVINLDSLGFEPSLVKMRTGHQEPGHWLAGLADTVIRDHGIETAWIAGGEDSMAFQLKGIDAVGLGQKPTAPDFIKIHSPMDSLENLHFGPVESAYSITLELINRLTSPDVRWGEMKGGEEQ